MRVGWGVPTYKRKIDVGVAEMFMRVGTLVGWLQHEKDIEFLGLIKTDTCSVQGARNEMVYMTQKVEGDWLIMSDADTYTLDPEKVFDMVMMGQEKGCAMIGAPCLMRNGKGYNVAIKRGDPWAKADQLLGRVQKVDRMGTGMVALNLGWLKEKWPESPWFQEYFIPGPKPIRVGSDISICDQIDSKGGQIYCYGMFEPVHVGVGNTGHPELDEREAARAA